jgi:hypothetical protein
VLAVKEHGNQHYVAVDGEFVDSKLFRGVAMKQNSGSASKLHLVKSVVLLTPVDPIVSASQSQVVYTTHQDTRGREKGMCAVTLEFPMRRMFSAPQPRISDYQVRAHEHSLWRHSL